MIALDTSSLIAFFAGSNGADIDAIDAALESGVAVLPPVVLAELLSDPKLPITIGVELRRIPVLEINDGYWERAGLLRAAVLKRKLKAKLPDTLVIQSCVDHRVPLISRDADFGNFLGCVRVTIIGL